MYKVYADDICIYDDSKSSNIETQLVNPKLTLADNTAGTFTATIPPTNIGYEYVSELGTTISIYRDDSWLWTGRVLSEDKDFWNNRKITCEGAMAFLNDTNQEQATYEHVSIASFITALLNRHNAKVESNRQIFVGEITVIDTEDPLTTYKTDYATTLSYLNEKLLDVFGGHMRIRQEGGVNYLDYLAIDDEHPVHTSTQTIDFGKNLLDFTKKFDAEKFATVLLPLGAQADDGQYVTVAAVNQGSKYVQSSAVETYGWIEKVIHFDNVAMPWRLMEKAQEYLADLQFDSVVIELKAVDLHYLDPEYEPFDILDHVRVISQPHGMDRAFQITKIDIPLDNPENVAYTLGGTVAQSFTSRYSSSVTAIKETIKALPTESSILDKAKEEATDLINNATQGYITITKTDDGSQELYITDTANYQNATKIWRWNLGGLGYSGDGGRTYGTAITMNGQIVADYITTGTLNADLITSGHLSGTRISGGTIDASDVTITNLNASNITSGQLSANYIKGGTIDATNVTISNLEVGTNVTMGPNATISWSKVTGTPSIPSKTSDLTNDSDFKNGTQVTQITRDTVTTAYVNALNVHAGSVDAENIQGTTISGKTIRLLKNGRVTGILDSDGLEITDIDGAQGVFINKGLYGAALQYDGIWLNKKVSSSDPTSLTNSINIYTEGNSNHPAGLLGYYVDSNDDRHNYGVNSWGLTLDNVTSPGIFANVPNHDLNNLNNRSELMTAHAILEAISIGGGGGGSGDISGSGTAGYIAKFTDTKEIGNLLVISSTGTRYLREDGTWGDPPGPTWGGGTGITVQNSSHTITLTTFGNAGTAGTSENTSGSSVSVPYVTMDAYGRVSSYGTHSHTITGFLKTAGGGTVTAGAGSDVPLTVKSNNSGSGAYIKFEDSTGAQLGYFGVSTAHKPLFNYNGTNTEISLAGHTHNYATPAAITAGTAGTSAATSGSALQVPYVTVNAQGIVTGYGTHIHTITGFLPASSVSGTSGYIAKFTGANSIGNGPAFGSDTTKYLRNDGSWVVPPDTNTTYSAGQGLVLNGTTFKIGSGTNAHVSQTGGTSGYVLITINSYTSWMLSFKVRLYAAYDMDEYIISGYNYGASHWYDPSVVHISRTGTARNIVFGYTADWHLWVAIPNRAYTGCDILDIVNGYVQVSADGLFTLSIVTTLPGTTQSTVGTSPLAKKSEVPTNTNQLTNGAGFITAAGSISGTASNVTGTVAIAHGGTGGTTVATARTNLAVPGCAEDGNGYPALARMNGNATWIRAAGTNVGFLPYSAAARGSGTSYLGTSTWYWGNAYIDNVHSANVGARLAISGSTVYLRDVDGNNISNVTVPAAPATTTWKIYSGTVTINPDNRVHVTFPSAIGGMPTIVATYATTATQHSAGNFGSIKISNKSATGFDIVIGGSTPTSAPADWVAFYNG